jgi:PAS domain S-box-containing protein
MRMSASLRPQGLGTYLSIAFAVASILLTLLLLGVIEVTVTRQIQRDIGNNLAELAAQMSSRLDRSMFERYREVQLMAERISASDHPGKFDDEDRRELDALQRTYPYYAWIGVTDEVGKVLVSTQGILANADVSARPWFQNARHGIFMGDVHEAKLLASLLPNPGGEPLRFVDIAFPYTQGSRANGVLAAHLSWEWARDIRRSIVEALPREQVLDALIVSADNSVLLGPPQLLGVKLQLNSLAGGAAAKNGASLETWPDGREYLVGFSQGTGYQGYRGMGWKVLLRQESQFAYQPVRLLRAQLLGIGLVVATLFSLLGLWVSRFITRPLEDLSKAAKQIEAGQPAEIVQTHAAYREVTELGESLNSLIRNLLQKEHSLLEMNADLENRVGQRTVDLTRALGAVQRSETRVRSIIESARAFVGIDFRGRITDWNVEAEKMLGWSRAEIIGKSMNLIIPERFQASLIPALHEAVRTGESRLVNTSLERVVLSRDGREIPVEVRMGLINNNALQLVSVFLHDISERRQMERLKSEFISTASHELRTPLTAIYASLDMLRSGMAGELPPDAMELLEVSHKSAQRLVRLINDVLDVEKIESGGMSYQFADQPLLPLVQQAIAATQAYADEYQVRIELVAMPGRDLVNVDADRIVQVVVNLLSNAAKFSPASGAVVMVCLAPRDGVVRLSVTDTGQGIPLEFHDRVFQRFAQADSSDRRQKGGTGLGLNICSSILVAHQGSIDFISFPGKGCEFYFDLPLVARA